MAMGVGWHRHCTIATVCIFAALAVVGSEAVGIRRQPTRAGRSATSDELPTGSADRWKVYRLRDWPKLLREYDNGDRGRQRALGSIRGV